MDRFEETKLRVKEANELVALVEGYVPLKRAGRNLVALCPFHQEKTPSFTVFPDSQHFKCFGCGRSGDAFTFVMEREGMSFREAFEYLAERAGIPLEGVFGKGRSEGGGAKQRQDAYEALAAVRGFFHGTLLQSQGEAARRYLIGRGLEGAIEAYGLGAHPMEPGRLLAFARGEGLPLEVLQAAGLLSRGGQHEPFLGRVIFPIEDERGRVVGFGGRVLPGQDQVRRDDDRPPPKYLNSPESPLFNKRRILFGLRRAKLAGTRRIVVMEGYTDVIAAQMAGIPGAVATLGTALTPDHARLLQRYATDGVVLLFDGDRAGRQAADRAFRELVTTELPLSIALLDEGFDPADMVAPIPGVAPEVVAERTARLEQIVAQAEDGLTMWFRLLRQSLDLSLDVNIQRVGEECAALLIQVESPVRRQALLARMAGHLGVSEASLGQVVRQKAKARARSAVRPQGPGAEAGGAAPTQASEPAAGAQLLRDVLRNPIGKADLELLSCFLAGPDLVAKLGGEAEILAAEVQTGGVREVLHEVVRLSLEGGIDRAGALKRMYLWLAERPQWRLVLDHAVEQSAAIRDPAAFLGLLRQGRQRHSSRQEAQRLRRLMLDARSKGDPALETELLQAYLRALRSESEAPPPRMEAP